MGSTATLARATTRRRRGTGGSARSRGSPRISPSRPDSHLFPNLYRPRSASGECRGNTVIGRLRTREAGHGVVDTFRRGARMVVAVDRVGFVARHADDP